LYSEYADRGQGFQILGCFWPLPTGHVTQRMCIGHFFGRKRFRIGTPLPILWSRDQ